MADIRQNTAPLDNFIRADENPLSHGGDWVEVATSGWGVMELEDNAATHEDSLTFGWAAWDPLALDGDDAECWARGIGGNAPGIAWGVGLIANIGGANSATDGYLFRQEQVAVGTTTGLYIVNNGGVTELDRNEESLNSGDPGYFLIRRNGGDVEGWGSDGGVNWTLFCTATDSTFTTDLHPIIGVADNSSTQLLGFNEFGAGPLSDYMPEFIRRPWRYRGVPLDL